jgi:hypothetical protein
MMTGRQSKRIFTAKTVKLTCVRTQVETDQGTVVQSVAVDKRALLRVNYLGRFVLLARVDVF